MRFDKGKELGSVHGCNEITGVENRALDLKILTGRFLSIVIVDQTLDFRGLDNWIQCSDWICDLDNLSCYGFPESLRYWRQKIGVEALEEFTKAFGTKQILVLNMTSLGKSHRILFWSIFVDADLLRIFIGVYQIFENGLFIHHS